MTNNQKVHEYKYLTFKVERFQEDIKFNKQCLSKNVTPNYVQLHTKIKSQAARRTIEIANKIWIKEEIKYLYKKLNDTKSKMKIVFEEIKSQYHNETIEEILQFISDWVRPKIEKKKETHIKKIKHLIDAQKMNIMKNNNITEVEFNTGIKNLTEIDFDDNELSLLSKSIKYNLNLDDKLNTIENDLLEVEVAIRQKEKETQDQLRFNFTHELDKYDISKRNKDKVSQKTKDQLKIVNSITVKLKENEAILTKADKSNTTVVINKNDYDNKVKDFISSNDFEILNLDPTTEFTKTTNEAINKCKSIPKVIKNQIKMIKPQSPTLRGQPKIHKEEIPIRPIVNFMSAPTYKLCGYLQRKIKRNIINEHDYSVINTLDLINKIKDKDIPQNSLFLSFDIKNMYTNIPISPTIKILKETLTQSKTLSKNEIEDIVKLTKIATSQNYFKFDSSYYIQKEGLAMGSPLSGLLADIYMHNMESKKIINEINPFYNKIKYWFRYVDDIICLFEGTEEESKRLLNYINSLSNTIQFSQEIQENKINFLDVTISKENRSHNFEIYRKPTTSDCIIPADSNHPWEQKMSTFHALTNRLINIPMNKSNFIKEKNIIKYLAFKNGYNPRMIENMIKKKQMKKKNKIVTEKQKNDFICVPYNSKFNRAIRKTFKNSKLNVSYRTKNNALEVINKRTKKDNNQVVTSKYENSGIYKIKCSDCEKYYIGQTGRSFSCRYKEHVQAFKSKNVTSMKSNVAEHMINENHKFTKIETDMTILDYGSKGNKLDTKEEYHIYCSYKNDPTNIINTMQVKKQNPIYEKILKLKNI